MYDPPEDPVEDRAMTEFIAWLRWVYNVESRLGRRLDSTLLDQAYDAWRAGEWSFAYADRIEEEGSGTPSA